MTGLQAYVLSKNKLTSVVSGIKRMYFDGDGHLIIECMDGTLLKRPFKDIKNVEFNEVINVDGEKETHLVVKYTDGTKEDVGIVNTEFDISKLITIGTSVDEKNATTPLFINTDGDVIDDDNLANDDDLDDIWNS